MIEILRAHDVRRYVRVGGRGCVLLVAAVHPVIEVVAALDIVDGHHAQRRIDELVRPARGHHALRAALAIDRGVSGKVGDAGGLAVLADIHAIAAGLIDHQCHRGRIDFVALAIVEALHRHVRRALGQFDLGELVVEGEEAEVGVVRDAQRAAVQLQFGAGVVAGGKAVAGGQRTVEAGIAPVFLAGRQQPHIAFAIGKPSHARRRIAGAIVIRWRLGLRLGQPAGTEQQGRCHPSPLSRRRQESSKHTHRVLRSWTRWASRKGGVARKNA